MMGDNAIRSLEMLIYEKVLLYEDLRGCLEEERECLIRVDLDRLWELSRRKEALCAGIRDVRTRLQAAAGLESSRFSFDFMGILDRVPAEFRPRFHGPHLRLMKSKAEIESLRRENMAFLDESLRFLDEIISIISGKQENRAVYDRNCRLMDAPADAALRREVV